MKLPNVDRKARKQLRTLVVRLGQVGVESVSRQENNQFMPTTDTSFDQISDSDLVCPPAPLLRPMRSEAPRVTPDDLLEVVHRMNVYLQSVNYQQPM